MNTKKKTVLAAALVVAIIALAGVGYAAFSDSYKGTTDSGSSTMDVDYVIVKLNSEAYSDVTTGLFVVFDTETTYVTDNYVVEYTWLGSSEVTQNVKIEIPENTDEDPDYYTIKAEVTVPTEYNGNYVLQWKIAGSDWSNYNSTTGAVLQEKTNATATINEWKTGKDILWRYVPDDGTGTGMTTVNTVVPNEDFAPQSSLTLPEITYTVNVNQTHISTFFSNSFL